MPDNGNNGDARRLDSWKDIAIYLKKDVRTVIRWEKTRALPVHRIPGGQRNVVFAYQHELDAWLIGQDVKVPDLPSPSSETQEEVLPAPAPATAPDDPEVSVERISPISGHAAKWKFLAAGTCLVALGLLTVFMLGIDSATDVRSPHFVQLTDDGRFKSTLRTDGTTLYFNEIEGQRTMLASSPLSGSPIHLINTPLPNVELQDVSRDGHDLLVTSYEGTEHDRPLWIISAQGGPPRRVGDALCRYARWSPDNQRIACASGATIIVLDANATVSRTVGPFHSDVSRLVWSPQGDRLRFVLDDPKTQAFSPWEIPVSRDTTAPLPAASKLPLGMSCCADWTWTPTDGSFAYAQLDAASRPMLIVKPERDRVSNWLARDTELPVKIGRVEAIAPSQKDHALYLLIENAYRGELLKFDAKHGAFEAMLHGLSAYWVSFSRDGQWMTYVGTLDNALWRSRVDGTEAVQLTTPPMEVELSAWSPDGRQIAFMGKLPGKPWRIFLVGRNGGRMEEAVPGNDNQGAPTWSLDSKAITYANIFCEGAQTCWVHRLDLTNRKTEIIPGSRGLRTARWSPDGKYIAALQPDTHDLMLFDVEKRRWTAIADSITGDNINWSSDSLFLYVDSPQGEKPIIERIRVSNGKRETVASLVPLQKTLGQVNPWIGLTPDNSPMLLHLSTTSDIYALDWADH